MSNNDTDLISAATALVNTSNSVKVEAANRTVNVIEDNKKNPIDVINSILKSLSNTAEKNSKDLINSNYNALDKIINSKLKTTTDTKSGSSSDKQESRADRVITANNLKESLPLKGIDKQYPSSASSNETQYYTRVFTILGKVLGIGKFAEGPEAGRLQTDLKESKITKSIISSPKAVTSEKEQGDGLVDMLKKLGIGLMLADILSGNFESVAQAIYQGIKASISTAMKVVGNIAGTISTKLSKLKTSLTSSKIYQGIKDTLKSIGESIGERFSSISASIGNTFTSIKNTAARAAEAILERARSIGGAIADYASPAVSRVQAAVAPVMSKVQAVAAPVISSGRAMLNTAWNWGGRVVDVGKRAVNTVVEPIKEIGTKAINQAINAVKGSIGAAGGTLSFLGKFGKLLMPVAKKIPVIGSLIELFFAKGDIAAYKQERAENKIQTDQELYRKAGNRVLEGIGGVLGGAGGAALGLVGGPLGALFGGFIGDHAGRYASQFASYIIPESTISDVGKAAVTGTILPVGDTGEMQDFIIKNNKVYKFSNKDEILGMKNGGAINELLQSSSINNKKQLFVASKQVSILEQIRDGIIMLTKNAGGTSTSNTLQSNNRDTKSIPAATFLRSNFNTSHNLQPI